MKFSNRILSLHRTAPDAALGGCWFHTVPPVGEYPGGNITHKGESVKNAVLVIDRTAYDSILSAFRSQAVAGFPGVLVDREHFSLDADKSSDAMAWAVGMREDADGLWTRWEFTPPGRDAWENKVLVSRSPVLELEHLGGKRFRPVALESIAMTNTPHFTLSTLAAARAAEDTRAGEGTQTKQGDPAMTRLLALLGLAESATEDEAVAALQSLIDKAAQVDAAVAAEQEAVAACRKLRCDAFVAAHRPRIADEAAFRKAHEAAPDAAEAAFAAARQAPATRISARDAAAPGDATAAARAGEREDAVQAAARKYNLKSRADAVARAQTERPELWK